MANIKRLETSRFNATVTAQSNSIWHLSYNFVFYTDSHNINMVVLQCSLTIDQDYNYNRVSLQNVCKKRKDKILCSGPCKPVEYFNFHR